MHATGTLVLCLVAVIASAGPIAQQRRANEDLNTASSPLSTQQNQEARDLPVIVANFPVNKLQHRAAQDGAGPYTADRTSQHTEGASQAGPFGRREVSDGEDDATLNFAAVQAEPARAEDALVARIVDALIARQSGAGGTSAGVIEQNPTPIAQFDALQTEPARLGNAIEARQSSDDGGGSGSAGGSGGGSGGSGSAGGGEGGGGVSARVVNVDFEEAKPVAEVSAIETEPALVENAIAARKTKIGGGVSGSSKVGRDSTLETPAPVPAPVPVNPLNAVETASAEIFDDVDEDDFEAATLERRTFQGEQHGGINPQITPNPQLNARYKAAIEAIRAVYDSASSSLEARSKSSAAEIEARQSAAAFVEAREPLKGRGRNLVGRRNVNLTPKIETRELSGKNSGSGSRSLHDRALQDAAVEINESWTVKAREPARDVSNSSGHVKVRQTSGKRASRDVQADINDDETV